MVSLGKSVETMVELFLAREASALVTPILSICQRISYYGKDEPREARPNLAEGLIL